MQCPQCQFENPPDALRCVKCDSDFNLATPLEPASKQQNGPFPYLMSIALDVRTGFQGRKSQAASPRGRILLCRLLLECCYAMQSTAARVHPGGTFTRALFNTERVLHVAVARMDGASLGPAHVHP